METIAFTRMRMHNCINLHQFSIVQQILYNKLGDIYETEYETSKYLMFFAGIIQIRWNEYYLQSYVTYCISQLYFMQYDVLLLHLSC